MKKKVLSLVILLFIGFGVISCSSDDTISVESSEQVVKSISDRKTQAREAGQRLLESFEKTRGSSLNDYPDYYGGGYINEDGKLVVFIKGELSTIQETVSRSVANDDVVTYAQATYSYKELKNTLANIASFIENNREDLCAKNIKYYYLNDFENNIGVELEDYSNMRVEEFKTKVTNFPGIVFKQCTRTFKAHSSSAGDKILTNPNGAYATIGYRATRYLSDGFVTAGHAFNTGDKAYNTSGTVIGTCDYSINAGSVDAAFVSIPNYSYMPNNGNLTGEEFNFWAGDDVTKLGATIYQSDGYVVSTSASVNADGVRLTDVAEATYLSAPGDSGGPVYLTSSRKLLGIHQGSGSFNAFFIKVSNISSQLNASFY